MKIEWTAHIIADFPDDEIIRLSKLMDEGYDDAFICREIREVVFNWDDETFYTWGPAQTEEVLDEVKRRTGSVQLNMFKELGME